MRTRQCVSCGATEGMQHFEGRTFTINTRGMLRKIPDIAGWECQVCHEREFDMDTDSAERYSLPVINCWSMREKSLPPK